MACMIHWAHDPHIPIDSSLYLEGITTKVIMGLKFNAGEGVAHLLACLGHTSAKTERICERKEALSAAENTQQPDKLLHLSKGVTRAPADSFWELNSNIDTFMSLVWVLFGSECDYYKMCKFPGSSLKTQNSILQRL